MVVLGGIEKAMTKSTQKGKDTQIEYILQHEGTITEDRTERHN